MGSSSQQAMSIRHTGKYLDFLGILTDVNESYVTDGLGLLSNMKKAPRRKRLSVRNRGSQRKSDWAIIN